MSYIDECLEHLFLLLAAQIIDKDPEVPFEKVRADVSNTLVSAGFSRDTVEKLCEKHLNLDDILDFHGLINPTYLQQETGKRFFFYIIDARGGRYGALSQLIKRWEGDLSRFIVYGPQDVILRLHGTDKEANLLYETLTTANYDPDVMEVERIHYYYRHPVKPHIAMEKIPFDDLNKLVKNWRSKEVPDQVRKEMLDRRILLGGVGLEKLAKTRRIRAFVGVDLVGMVPLRFKRRFLDYLLNLKVVQSCLSSVYECRTGLRYAFIVELIAGDPNQLDIATDEISLSYSGAGRVESSTFIIAKANEKMPLLSKKESLVLPGVSFDAYLNYVKKIEDYFVPYLNEGQRLAYSELSPRKQHFLISSLDDLTSLDLSDLEDEDRNRFEEGLRNYAIGCILDERPKIESAINLINASLERTCRRSLVKLIDIFLLGDFPRAQKELSLPKKEVWKFTLGQCYKSFEHWNESMYKDFFVFPEYIPGLVLDFLEVRNPIAHGIPKWIDLDIMKREVRTAMFKGIQCVGWLQKNIVYKELEMVPVENALKISAKIIEKHKDSKKELNKVLTEVLKTQEIAIETRNLLTLLFTDFHETGNLLIGRIDEIDEAHKQDLEQMLQNLTAAVTEKNDKALRKAISAIIDKQEEIVKDTKKLKRGITTGLIQFAKKTTAELPSEVLGNLISQIILNLSPKFLPVMIDVFSKVF